MFCCSGTVQWNNGCRWPLNVVKDTLLAGGRSDDGPSNHFYFVVGLMIVNAFILESKQIRKPFFRLKLVRPRQIKRRGSPAFLANMKREVSEVLNEVRLKKVGNHMPVKCTRRKCWKCNTKQKEIRIDMMCHECKVPLCIHSFC